MGVHSSTGLGFQPFSDRIDMVGFKILKFGPDQFITLEHIESEISSVFTQSIWSVYQIN